MDIRLALMCGTDIPIPECLLTIHLPRIKEIALIGELDFFTGVQCLCLNKLSFVKDKSLVQDTSNFLIFMTVMSEKEAADKKKSVMQVCTLFFPKYKFALTPRSLLLMSEDNTILIDENNFDILQEMISSICCLKTGSSDLPAFNPANEKAREIAEKLMRGRLRVAEQKGENNISIFSLYLSIITVGLESMSLLNAMDLTIFLLYDLVERLRLYTSWDIDVRSRLAGGKPSHEPENWMKNIH